MNTIIESLNWRYATKKYDATRKVSENDLSLLKEAVRLSVSSIGLQPYKVIIIENPAIRERLKASAYGQSAITDASHLFVFANEVNIGEKQVEAYLANITNTRGISRENLNDFATMIYGSINNMTPEQKNIWTSKQTYIALSTLINIAAYLNIDATPMEGFNSAEFNSILGLDEMGLNTSVIATIGYRHPQDTFQNLKKVRKPASDFFIKM